PSGLRALSAAERCSLRSALVRGEAHSVRDIRYEIAISINPKFIDRLGREGDVGGGARWVHAGRRMDVHNQDRFVGIPGLRESIQVSKIEAGIPVGKAKVRT